MNGPVHAHPPMAAAGPALDAGPRRAPWMPTPAFASAAWRPTRIVEAFVVFQLLCQVALLSGAIGQARVLVRGASFGAALLLLVMLRGRGTTHPAAGAGALVLVVLGVSFFNPATAGTAAGLVQFGLYAAVIAPLFWVSRLNLDMGVLRRVVLILWLFHSLGAVLAVAQVRNPGVFQPTISTVVASKGKGYMESLKITTASGQRVFRPMGLTDIPGGAGIHGLYAVLFGIGFFLTRRRPLMLAGALASIGFGVTCLYLAQVRALMVMTAVTIVVLLGVLAWRRDVKRLAALVVALGAVVGAGYAAAVSMTGPAAAKRVQMLVAQPASQVYYDNRGRFLEDALTKQLPQAPLGEGLGHWGMSATYFGASSTQARPIWVEIQWAGWIVDGGAPLVVAYVLALLLTLLAAWRIARARPPSAEAADLPFWGAVVLAYGVGAVALTFSYPIFVSQAGMEFWLVSALLFACARHAYAARPA